MSVAIYYLKILPDLRAAAHRHGYALAIHGSLERDFDLVAVPWETAASPADVLVTALMGAAGGCHWNQNARAAGQSGHALDNPTRKPHGRLAWSLQLGGGAYLDLSVVPRHEQTTAATDAGGARGALSQ